MVNHGLTMVLMWFSLTVLMHHAATLASAAKITTVVHGEPLPANYTHVCFRLVGAEVC